jgi:hypothetical protein
MGKVLAGRKGGDESREIDGPIGAHLAECNNSSRIEFNPRLFYLLPILRNPIHQTLYRAYLSFIGIGDVQTVRAEGMNIPPLATHAVPNGEKAVEALVI